MFEILSLYPYITIMDSDLPEDLIQSMLQVENFQHSEGYDSLSQTSSRVMERTSLTFFDNRSKFDHIVDYCLHTVHRNTGDNFKLEQTEILQITRYSSGQFYTAHYDHFNLPDVPHIENDRIATIILYLNDDYQGGGTWFTDIPLMITPHKGRICYFKYPPEYDLTFYRHEGCEVISGQKTIAQIWIRQRPYREIKIQRTSATPIG
jgi:hypothetical protein